MSEAQIRQKIFETLSQVPGIGRVYNYERWSADWSKFIALFQDPASGRILGCEITRPSVASDRIGNQQTADSHRYVIRRYMGVQDSEATELDFEATTEAIRDAFRLDSTLGGTCSESGAVSKISGDTRMFGNVLCHYAELAITATEY